MKAALWSVLEASLATYASNIGVSTLLSFTAFPHSSAADLALYNALRLIVVSTLSSIGAALLVVPVLIWLGKGVGLIVVSLLVIAIFMLPQAVVFLPKGESFSASVGRCEVYVGGKMTECGWDLTLAELWHPAVLAAVYLVSLLIAWKLQQGRSMRPEVTAS